MKFVEIYKLQNDGSHRVVATCTLANRKVVCEGDEAFVKNLESEGIFNYLETMPEKIYPEDGILFLENLRFSFRSGYLNASKVREE